MINYYLLGIKFLVLECDIKKGDMNRSVYANMTYYVTDVWHVMKNVYDSCTLDALYYIGNFFQQN